MYLNIEFPCSFLNYCMLQAREKFLSLRKGTKNHIASVLEEVLFSMFLNDVYLDKKINWLNLVENIFFP